MKTLLIFPIIGMIILGGYFFATFVHEYVKRGGEVVKIGNGEFQVEIASNPLTQQRGLSGRTELKAGTGMLFIFPIKSAYGFWMKDMKFSIDIVWIAGNNVIGVSPDLSPDDSQTRQIYYPPGLADLVLEIPSGAARSAGIQTGNAVVRNVVQ